jgi:outer membrane protein with beta-barrel domain
MPVRRLIILAAAALVAHPAAAQGPFSLDLGGGPSFPFGHAKTNASSLGFDALVGAIAHAPFLPLSLRIDGAYNEYDHTSGESGARQIWAVSGNVMYLFPMFPVTPYVIAGAGWYHTSENLRHPDQTVPTLAATHFGIDGGAGVRRRLFGVGPGLGIGVFAEIRYQHYFGSRSGSMLPIVVGVNFPSITEDR